MEIRSLSPIRTPENVTLQVELAGLGNRVLAYGIDFLAMGSLMATLTLMVGLAISWNSEWSRTLLPVLLFCTFFGFQFMQEWLWGGRTLGKRVMNIRVVRINGQPIGVWEAFGRNLLRVIDVYFLGLGFVALLISGREQRFGDLLCGTLVVQDQRIAAPFARQDEANEVGLTPEEAELLRAYEARKSVLLPAERVALSDELRAYFATRLRISADQLPEALARVLLAP